MTTWNGRREESPGIRIGDWRAVSAGIESSRQGSQQGRIILGVRTILQLAIPPGSLSGKKMRFFAAELTRALNENAYGVESYRQDGSKASIVTMEGKELTIECVNDGFVVRPCSISPWEFSHIPHEQVAAGQTYETLDSLLLNSSPAFMQKMSDRLMEKLMIVRMARADEEQETVGDAGHAAEE